MLNPEPFGGTAKMMLSRPRGIILYTVFLLAECP
ncbi:hypothetical protein FOQG_02985 [Fusarium oxysporum f. sp. raphani 54005]|uniref:Uncharacterized protein n=2 Tax=Fusarium oxysporum TaxID=5507 RepID=X0D4C4_FUSOX|nr:hypothetical protein FOQG_02985 [Fusarium oxysporum f. sp. raphani 54005]EXL77895.1 hypothetical protein FOPG_07803 [Fusarium oxysporum f. sp. conglutinans race 2 54008]